MDTQSNQAPYSGNPATGGTAKRAGPGSRSAGGAEADHLLDEQIAYYRALAADYLDQGLDLPGGDELTEALDAFRPAGSVLELACGPGVWTGRLLRYAAEVTAVDASEVALTMLAKEAARRGLAGLVTPVQADLRAWRPEPGGYALVLGTGYWDRKIATMNVQRTGFFRVEIRNLGIQPNRFTLTTN